MNKWADWVCPCGRYSVMAVARHRPIPQSSWDVGAVQEAPIKCYVPLTHDVLITQFIKTENRSGDKVNCTRPQRVFGGLELFISKLCPLMLVIEQHVFVRIYKSVHWRGLIYCMCVASHSCVYMCMCVHMVCEGRDEPQGSFFRNWLPQVFFFFFFKLQPVKSLKLWGFFGTTAQHILCWITLPLSCPL